MFPGPSISACPSCIMSATKKERSILICRPSMFIFYQDYDWFVGLGCILHVVPQSRPSQYNPCKNMVVSHSHVPPSDPSICDAMYPPPPQLTKFHCCLTILAALNNSLHCHRQFDTPGMCVIFNLHICLFPRKQESEEGMRSMDLPFVGEDEVLSW